MRVFYEQPLTLFIAGVALLVVCLVALVKTGRIGFLYAAGGVVIGTALLLWVERQLVSVREEIYSELESIGEELVADNVPAVIGHISESAPGIRDQAERLLRRVRVDRLAIKSNLKITEKEGDKDHLVAQVNVVAVGSERRGAIRNQTSPQYVTVEFVREGGQWRIVNYDRKAPHEGLR